MKIGFIGLGIMGKPMAKNLLKAGYTDLLVNNRSQASVQELVAAGAKAASRQEIGAQCDVVITMLPYLLTAAPSPPSSPKKSMPNFRKKESKCWTLPFPAVNPKPLTVL